MRRVLAEAANTLTRRARIPSRAGVDKFLTCLLERCAHRMLHSLDPAPADCRPCGGGADRRPLQRMNIPDH